MSANSSRQQLSIEQRELGMDREITRRDFLNSIALGAGSALMGAAAPALAQRAGERTDPETVARAWTGPGGVGDYARSNGNTWDVVAAGHGIRDAQFEQRIASATATNEIYDLVIVGGGFAGVIGAYTFLKATQRRRPVLLLDNHPLLGGEAKRNEFIVRGHRLIGPQGSNEADVPNSGWRGEMWRDIGLPASVSDFEFATLRADRRAMDLPLDNYHYYFSDVSENYGFFFEEPSPHWVRNPWGNELKNTPWPEAVRRDMLRWRDEVLQPFDANDEQLERWLDTMTYEEYLVRHCKLNPAVARYADPFLAAGAGLGCDALSAYVAYYFNFPGFTGLSRKRPVSRRGAADRMLAEASVRRMPYSFPGGNDAILRALIKWLNPDAIEGTTSFADMHNGRIRFDELDRPGDACRMRAGATVVRVEHDPDARRKSATITYLKDGKLFSVSARTVIYAGASWTGKRVITRLPPAYRAAMESFHRSPILVVNVALDNWRALYELGYSVCTWSTGFGFNGNIRAPMCVGDYRPPLDPDEPTLFTMYVPFHQHGLPIADQGKIGRAKMFGTSYQEYEEQIRRQLTKLFGSAGFDAKRDVAGIILNRWGHAYVNAGPGFFFGRNGEPAPSDVLRRPLGNLAFAHSELSGHQTYPAAGEEGRRAAEQMLTLL